MARTVFCSCVDACCTVGLDQIWGNLHGVVWTGLVRSPDQTHLSPSLTPQEDVLNRMSSTDSVRENVHLMKYIFPRQFGLQNVFSGSLDGGDNQFRSDKSREEEIAALGNTARLRRLQNEDDKRCEDGDAKADLKLPKRLRGQALDLTRRLRTNHSQCAYAKLLQYYCPDVSNVHAFLSSPTDFSS